jgi:hypothetical protein
LPNSSNTILPAGVPVTVPVTITNTGAAPEAFFIDARLNTTTSLPLALAVPPGSSGFPLPLPQTTIPPLWVVPTQTSSVEAAATATLPIEFDYVESEPIHIEEADTTFAIGWMGRYRIDGPAFVYSDHETGRLVTILGYPTDKLSQIA